LLLTGSPLAHRYPMPDGVDFVKLLAPAYAVSDLSLKDIAARAGALDVTRITGPGLLYRLREARHGDQWTR